jgi:hypothetical protein
VDHAGVLNSSENLDKIRGVLEKAGPIIIQHWHFYGARAPDCMAFADFCAFVEYLRTEAASGDAIDVWSMSDVCKPENRLAEGKCPDHDGRTPQGGAN